MEKKTSKAKTKRKGKGKTRGALSPILVKDSFGLLDGFSSFSQEKFRLSRYVLLLLSRHSHHFKKEQLESVAKRIRTFYKQKEYYPLMKFILTIFTLVDEWSDELLEFLVYWHCVFANEYMSSHGGDSHLARKLLQRIRIVLDRVESSGMRLQKMPHVLAWLGFLRSVLFVHFGRFHCVETKKLVTAEKYFVSALKLFEAYRRNGSGKKKQSGRLGKPFEQLDASLKSPQFICSTRSLDMFNVALLMNIGYVLSEQGKHGDAIYVWTRVNCILHAYFPSGSMQMQIDESPSTLILSSASKVMEDFPPSSALEPVPTFYALLLHNVAVDEFSTCKMDACIIHMRNSLLLGEQRLGLMHPVTRRLRDGFCALRSHVDADVFESTETLFHTPSVSLPPIETSEDRVAAKMDHQMSDIAARAALGESEEALAGTHTRMVVLPMTPKRVMAKSKPFHSHGRHSKHAGNGNDDDENDIGMDMDMGMDMDIGADDVDVIPTENTGEGKYDRHHVSSLFRERSSGDIRRRRYAPATKQVEEMQETFYDTDPTDIRPCSLEEDEQDHEKKETKETKEKKEKDTHKEPELLVKRKVAAVEPIRVPDDAIGDTRGEEEEESGEGFDVAESWSRHRVKEEAVGSPMRAVYARRRQQKRDHEFEQRRTLIDTAASEDDEDLSSFATSEIGGNAFAEDRHTPSPEKTEDDLSNSREESPCVSRKPDPRVVHDGGDASGWAESFCKKLLRGDDDDDDDEKYMEEDDDEEEEEEKDEATGERGGQRGVVEPGAGRRARVAKRDTREIGSHIGEDQRSLVRNTEKQEKKKPKTVVKRRMDVYGDDDDERKRHVSGIADHDERPLKEEEEEEEEEQNELTVFQIGEPILPADVEDEEWGTEDDVLLMVEHPHKGKKSFSPIKRKTLMDLPLDSPVQLMISEDDIEVGPQRPSTSSSVAFRPSTGYDLRRRRSVRTAPSHAKVQRGSTGRYFGEQSARLSSSSRTRRTDFISEFGFAKEETMEIVSQVARSGRGYCNVSVSIDAERGRHGTDKVRGVPDADGSDGGTLMHSIVLDHVEPLDDEENELVFQNVTLCASRDEDV